MIYLLLQVIFASMFTLVIKWAQNRGRDDILTIGAINYIAAGLAILPVFLMNNPQPVAWGALWTGGSMGCVYFTAFFFVIYAIRMVGASSTTVVSVLSILMPITFAAFVWKQQPNFWQMVGIGLALLSLTLIGAQKNKRHAHEEPKYRWLVPAVLAGFFLLCGFSRLAQETFKHVSEQSHRPAFLLAAFTCSGVPSLVLLLYRRRRITMVELVVGSLLGLSNVLQTHFILKALGVLEGYIVFPISSAGAILVTTLIAVGFLGEQINRRTCVGIGLSVVSLFMLHSLS